MSDQLGFKFNPTAERRKRDRALDLLEGSRGAIVEAAHSVALELCETTGRVTSPDVLAELKARGFDELLEGVDPRFMGAVFRAGRGWRRLGFENKGSHARPVSVWTRNPAKGAA
jgi:hypothetical protein